MGKRQHHKGHKRPRAWHRSKSNTHRLWWRLRAADKLYERAERDLGTEHEEAA